MAIFQSLVRLGVAGNLSKYGRVINDARLCSAIVNRMNQCSYKSTGPPASSAQTPPKDPLDLSFDCHIAAFKSKTTADLIRAYFVFQICSFEFLVENNMKVKTLHNLNYSYIQKTLKKYIISIQNHEIFSVEYSVLIFDIFKHI